MQKYLTQKKKLQKILKYTILFILLALSVTGFTKKVNAQTWRDGDGWNATSYGMSKDENGDPIYVLEPYNDSSSYKDETDFMLYISNAASDGITEVKFYSSNTKVAKIDSDRATAKIKPGDIYCLARVKTVASGTSVITAKVGDKEYTFKLIVKPYVGAKMNPVKRINYKSIKISWKKVDCATGYIVARVKRTGNDLGKLETVKHVSANETSLVLNAPYNVNYGYFVIPKMKVGARDYYTMGEPNYYWQIERIVFYKLTYNNAKITKLSPGASKVTLNWATNSNIKEYRIYRRKDIYSSWKLIYTEKRGSVGSRTLSAQAGTSYIYKVEYVFPEYKVTTSERSCYVPKKASKKKTRIKIKLNQYFSKGQYRGGYSATRDNTFYYVRRNVLHVVCVNERILYDYSMKSNGKVKSKKKVKLCKYDSWGGFYYAPDGCIYVAVGYPNSKKSNSKTVIKVLKYSASWKLQKTCYIKGKERITTPFVSGNLRMEMRGTKIYMVTSKLMFNGHQANVAFLIDTKTMKYKSAYDSYVSHSFNQFVRFDANNLYVVDHGDAYDRGINVVEVKNYGTKNASTKELLPFKIKGAIGNNYTGLKLGGVEITGNNILMAGISVPQNYKVAGVTGNKEDYVKNVFLTITDKNTSKSRIKWLTTYNPKKSKVQVDEVRTIKLSDDAVVIMYTTTLKSKSTLHYVVVNDQGNVICKKDYKNMEFTASSQPILYNGAINWVDVKVVYKKVKWYGQTFYDEKLQFYSYRIPAVLK